ncbi:transposase [Edaphobacter sp. HDX4]
MLAELSTLPSGLTVWESVAHSGLDPAHEMSGSSIRKASRISRAGNRYLAPVAPADASSQHRIQSAPDEVVPS